VARVPHKQLCGHSEPGVKALRPRQRAVTGYMFGKGVYFADSCSKSAQYCFAQPDSPVGLMLLSRVALGNV